MCVHHRLFQTASGYMHTISRVFFSPAIVRFDPLSRKEKNNKSNPYRHWSQSSVTFITALRVYSSLSLSLSLWCTRPGNYISTTGINKYMRTTQGKERRRRRKLWQSWKGEKKENVTNGLKYKHTKCTNPCMYKNTCSRRMPSACLISISQVVVVWKLRSYFTDEIATTTMTQFE